MGIIESIILLDALTTLPTEHLTSDQPHLLIHLVEGPDATTHEARQKFRCPKCKAKGNNTYQIVWWGNSSGPSLVTSDLGRLRLLDIALDGARVKP